MNELKIRELKGNGDFRSDECKKFLDECDIVVTNPPFSLFREYINQLMEYGKEFIVIGNKNAITYKEIFPLIKKNKIWLGITSPKDFQQPKDAEKKSMAGLTRWFTNLVHNKRTKPTILTKRYSPDKYPKYDNYDAIEVSRVEDIPIDYDGVIGVPVTFLDKMNDCYIYDDTELAKELKKKDLKNFSLINTQFEIVGLTNSNKEVLFVPCRNNDVFARINGKKCYSRLLIRRISNLI